MKEGWEYKKLGEVCTSMADGPFGSNLKKEHYTTKKEVRIIQLSNIGEEGWREENKKYTTFEHLSTIKRSEVRHGDIVIAKMMPAGRAIICPNKETAYVLSSDAVKAELKDGVNNRFILYQINSPFFRNQVYANVSGSGRVRTSLKKLRDCKLGVPPLSEQQRIVSYLDAAFAKIDAVAKNAEDSLNDAKALFQSALAKMMEPKEGWEEKTLSEIGMTLTGTTPSKSNSAFYGDYMPFIRPSEINYDGLGNLDYNSQIKLSKEGSEAGRVIKPGSILMVCIGATISKVGYSKQDVSCNQQINVIKPYDEYNYKFIYYAMTAPSFKAKVIKEGSSSQATLPIINKKKWEQLTIAYPSLDEQNLIADKLDRLNQKIHVLSSNLTLTLSECAALKQALLRETFE